MNFFTAQDQARRNTKRLVILFSVAVLSLIIITNLLVAISFWIMDGQLTGVSEAQVLLQQTGAGRFDQYFSWQNFGKICLIVSGVIFLVIAFKWLQLASGGKRVAESLGGRVILPSTDNPNERLLLNVVEEMALASGMPVPAVYLLPNEKGINAFAAGYSPGDAVIGITQGALDQFNREQLQGVVAHEFSHILNGDMRLNIQMIALLSGIVFIGNIGHILTRTGGRHGSYHSTSRSADSRIFLLGLVLLIIGWLGTFFGGLIKAAVSRQREFLADASAVQFTRNPKGIADALKIIGGYNAGSQLFSPRVHETSHLFIAHALGSLTRFDSHPPLETRIQRVEPGWDGRMIERTMRVEPYQQGSALNGEKARAREAAAAATAAAAFIAQRQATTTTTTENNIDNTPQLLAAIPSSLIALCQEPFGATALAYGLLLDKKPGILQQQLDYIERSGIKGLAIQCQQSLADIHHLDITQRLPLIELAMPALKLMSAEQYKIFKRTLLLLIRADKKMDLFEWSLYQLLTHYLDSEFNKSRAIHVHYSSLKPIANDYAMVLSCLAHRGHKDQVEAALGFNKACQLVELNRLSLLPLKQCQLDDFGKAVTKLSQCLPLLKPKILKSFAACVCHDQKITPQEAELLAAIAAVMDCPQPPLEFQS
ncbi:M48 family metallopeptidase [Oceanicoccus sp. KOV_DT_Chl]|uniref:M48 family metallopeptidase n=1 Tax=Oceanicoccus sp. KOV_DT_Chl TaxID=1904639 RepID=UPI000C7D82D2|nr:M48 family metallopeptidase [Oceanicoccus sp. KOV_DT_Chl]